MNRPSLTRLLSSKGKNFRAAALTKYFVAGAMSFALLALSVSFPTAKAQSGSWQLKEIKVFTKLSGYSAVTSETYNKDGGNVEINVKGDALGLCPGGAEKMRFTWRFEGDASRLTNGGTVTVNLQAGVLSVAKPCTGTTIAQFSGLSIYGGGGGSSPLSEEENKLVDSDRFRRMDDQYDVRAAEYRKNSTTSLKVSAVGNFSHLPLAYFDFTVGTRAGDIIRYVYIYQSDSGGGATGGSLTVEDNTDRPGADYKDFDLSQANWTLCRDACANDGNCRAYAYVRPGVQGPSARCWLKSSVPAAVSSNCCIAGVRQ